VKHRIYSGAELQAILLASGFASVELYGTLDGTPYEHEHPAKLVAVARPAGAGFASSWPVSPRLKSPSACHGFQWSRNVWQFLPSVLARIASALTS